MPETITLLEQATNAEANKFMELVAELQHDDLYMFIHAVSEMKLIDGGGPINEIIHIARNVKNIDAAINDFYVA
jgi:hypothetical protein